MFDDIDERRRESCSDAAVGRLVVRLHLDRCHGHATYLALAPRVSCPQQEPPELGEVDFARTIHIEVREKCPDAFLT